MMFFKNIAIYPCSNGHGVCNIIIYNVVSHMIIIISPFVFKLSPLVVINYE